MRVIALVLVEIMKLGSCGGVGERAPERSGGPVTTADYRRDE